MNDSVNFMDLSSYVRIQYAYCYVYPSRIILLLFKKQ